MKIIENYQGISNAVLVDSESSNNTTAIFAGIHGNETSGIIALAELLQDFRNERIEILSGRVIFVLIGNEIAFQKGLRQIGRNLNRLFGKDILRDSSYEYHRSRELMELMDETDVLLDIHSTSGESEPFLFSDQKHLAFADKLGIGKIVTGWSDLPLPSLKGDTDNYMSNAGKIGFTFESGNHDAHKGEKVAKQVALNFLATFGHVSRDYKQLLATEIDFFHITGAKLCQTGNFRFAIKGLQNFKKIPHGQLVAFDGEEEIRANGDFSIIMPNFSKLEKGEEAYFLGREYTL